MTKIKLDCTMAQFQRLHEAGEKKGETAHVPMDAFRALLRDHSKLYDHAKNEVTHD